MLAKIEIILFSLSLFLISFGPISLPFLNDSRILGALLAGCLFIIKILFSVKQRLILSAVLDNKLFLVYAFFLMIFISSILHPPIDNRNELMIILGGLSSFLAGYIMFIDSGRNMKKQLNLAGRILNSIIITVSIVSILTVIGGKPFISLLENLFNHKIITKLYFEYNRGRIFPLASIDVIIPFSYSALLINENPHIFKPFLAKSAFLLALTTLMLANFRSRILVAVAVIVLMIFLHRKKHLTHFIKTATAFFVIAIILNLFILPTNIISRFLLIDKTDYSNLESRFHNMKLALEVNKTSPFLGIGTGNLKNYVNIETTLTKGASDQNLIYTSYQHPHNLYFKLLAENGVLGLALYVVLILRFISLDLILIKNSFLKPAILPFVAAGWSFMIGSALDWYSGAMIVYFFIIRGILQGISARI